jgi:hypothetical protein
MKKAFAIGIAAVAVFTITRRGASGASPLSVTDSVVKPTVSTHAVCRGDQPFVSVDLGRAPVGYDGPALVTIGLIADDVAAIALSDMELWPEGEVSSTVDIAGPASAPVTIMWPDGSTSSRVVRVPRCP